jgi:carbon storage regulator
MLVLTRKQAQSLCINGNITVTVLKVRGNQVRLGLEVPQGLPVRRQPAPNKPVPTLLAAPKDLELERRPVP